MSLLVIAAACLVAFQNFPVARGMRPSCNATVLRSSEAGVGFGTCPSQCEECCGKPRTVSFFGLRKPSRKWFNCLLKDSVRPADNVACKNIRQLDGKGAEHLFKMECQLQQKIYKQNRMRKDPLLKHQCSKTTRCCCDGKGMSLCLGDQTNSYRLKHVYGKQLPKLRLTKKGLCPAGFSEYDLDGELCKCDVACGKPDAPPRALPSHPFWAQMSSLAAGIYDFESPVSGWILVKRWDVDEGSSISNDEVGIYSKRLPGKASDTCVLAFAGTNDLKDVIANISVFFSKEWCGYKDVHRGFAGKSDDFMKRKRFHEFSEYLSDPKTCGGDVIAVGHSMGGAIASLVAACANKRSAGKFRYLPTRRFIVGRSLFKPMGMSYECVEKKGVRFRYTTAFKDIAEHGPIYGQSILAGPAGKRRGIPWLRVKIEDIDLPRGLQFDEVYTFAAPSVSKKVITDALTSDGCFPGGRFFIQDKHGYDPVPAIAQVFGFKHPKMNMIRLRYGNKGTDEFDHQSTECATGETRDFGVQDRVRESGKDISAEPSVANVKISVVTRHASGEYVQRFEKDRNIGADPLERKDEPH